MRVISTLVKRIIYLSRETKRTDICIKTLVIIIIYERVANAKLSL